MPTEGLGGAPVADSRSHFHGVDSIRIDFEGFDVGSPLRVPASVWISACRPRLGPPGADFRTADEIELTGTQRTTQQEPTWAACAAESRQPHARLVPAAGAGGCHDMWGEELALGRHAACDVVLEDPKISARHLRVYCSEVGGPRHFFLEQLGANGSFINDHRMRKGDTRTLQHGDVVSLCTHARDARQPPTVVFLFVIQGRAAVATPASAATLPPARLPAAAVQPAAPCSAGASSGPAPSQTVSERWVHDSWDLREVLGSGFFSRVHVGLQVKTGERRAVKVVDKSKFLSFQARSRSHLQLSSEAEVLTSLEHPGIVRFHEWFQTDSHFFLVMELVEGGDLLFSSSDIMTNGCYAERAAARLFGMLTSAIGRITCTRRASCTGI
ncbi:unnamed protein product [Prorocentrum cordatum]|uniref:non-specific serine/threonine protein kinase n=1 Tax=Prorocentrum cordatum TaxID=2364126 RepID=A0ABN9S8Y2_9DINO|nr:unnamed protein product [Polarella glacialis]